MNRLLWILLAAILSTLPFIMIKKYTLTDNYVWLVLTLIVFMVIIYTYIQVIHNNHISIVGPLIKIIEIILLAIAGMMIFNEKLEYKHFIGLLFGVTSIGLLVC